MMFKWLASSCTSVHEVMVRREVLTVVFVSSSACFFVALITEPAVIALVDLTNVMRLLIFVKAKAISLMLLIQIKITSAIKRCNRRS